MQKHLLLAKYYKMHFTNMLHSKSIKKKAVPFFSKCKFSTGLNNLNTTQYLYLYLLCRKVPIIQKRHNNKSRRVKSLNFKNRFKSAFVFFKSRRMWKSLQLLLATNFLNQPPAEKRLFELKKKEFKFLIANMPLTAPTMRLQSANHYLSEVPFSLAISFNNVSLFDKIYFVKSFKLWKAPNYLKGLSKKT